MSQYPSPYYNPQHPPAMGYGGGVDPARQALAPCRRAAILMFVYAALMILGGTYIAREVSTASNAEIEQIIAHLRSQAAAQTTAQVTVEFIRGLYYFMAGINLVVGILYAILAIFVRRGGRGAIITALVLTILGVLLTGCGSLSSLAQGASANGLAALVPLALLVWLMIWLFSANSAAGRWQAWQMQYAAQYYQYQQAQQAFPSQQPQSWQQPMPGQWPAPNSWQQPPPQQPPPQQQWPPPPSTPT